MKQTSDTAVFKKKTFNEIFAQDRTEIDHWLVFTHQVSERNTPQQQHDHSPAVTPELAPNLLGDILWFHQNPAGVLKGRGGTRTGPKLRVPLGCHKHSKGGSERANDGSFTPDKHKLKKSRLMMQDLIPKKKKKKGM